MHFWYGTFGPISFFLKAVPPGHLPVTSPTFLIHGALWQMIFFLPLATTLPNGKVLDLVLAVAPVLLSHNISRMPTQ